MLNGVDIENEVNITIEYMENNTVTEPQNFTLTIADNLNGTVVDEKFKFQLSKETSHLTDATYESSKNVLALSFINREVSVNHYVRIITTGINLSSSCVS